MRDSTLRLCSLLLLLPVLACGDSGSREDLPVNIIDFTDDEPGSCLQPTFPADQPDLPLFTPPRFLLTTSRAQESRTGQAEVNPGDPVLVDVKVNAQTRQVFAELADVWDSRVVIASASTTTSANETVSFDLRPESFRRGRYYMRLTLCGADCNDTQVIFETQPCVDGLTDRECAHNVPYLRTVVKEGLAEEPVQTCVVLQSYPGYGSGTIVIQ